MIKRSGRDKQRSTSPRRDDDKPLLPETTSDEHDPGWGDEARGTHDERDEAWYRRERPPHHE